jgi:NADPH:quinone reductase-like Zn-dependent oxidoreductase
MKAIIQNRYGDENTLESIDVSVPVITKPNQFLIKVAYANVSSGDKNINTLDQPFFIKLILRLLFGWNGPKAQIRGISGSGIVESVGSDVVNAKVGDHVNFINSMKAGVLAEYLVLSSDSKFAVVDSSVNLVDAAPIAFGAMSAYHFINEHSLKEGDDIYIYGASGAVGTYALSLATHFKANITAVASQKHHEKLSGFPIQKFIDYKNQNPFDIQQRFDVIFDAVGKIKKSDIQHLLKPNGKFYSIKSPTKEDSQRLAQLNEWLKQGSLKTIIDNVYDFEDYKQAHAHVYAGHKSGNVIIKVAGVTQFTDSK